MDFLRYVSSLAIFVITSWVLFFSLHLLVLWHTRRRNELPPARQK